MPGEPRDYGWRSRFRSFFEYLYVEQPPRLEWDGQQWVPAPSQGLTTGPDGRRIVPCKKKQAE